MRKQPRRDGREGAVGEASGFECVREHGHGLLGRLGEYVGWNSYARKQTYLYSRHEAEKTGATRRARQDAFFFVLQLCSKRAQNPARHGRGRGRGGVESYGHMFLAWFQSRTATHTYLVLWPDKG